MPLQNQFAFAADVIEAFTEGDCWALADELRILTGWAMVGIGWNNEAEEGAFDRSWEHIANRRPDGLIIDITGVHSDKAWIDGWNGGFARDMVVFDANDARYIEGMVRSYRKSPKHWAKKLLSANEQAQSA